MKKIFFSIVFVLMGFVTPAAYAADGITTGNVNLRTGPGVKYAKRGTLPSGYRLNIGHCQGNWCRVNSRRGAGWVSTRYLAFNQGVTRSYRRAAPVVVMSFAIGYHRPYHYRSYRSRGPRYRGYHPRRHHVVVRQSHRRYRR